MEVSTLLLISTRKKDFEFELGYIACPLLLRSPLWAYAPSVREGFVLRRLAFVHVASEQWKARRVLFLSRYKRETIFANHDSVTAASNGQMLARRTNNVAARPCQEYNKPAQKYTGSTRRSCRYRRAAREKTRRCTRNNFVLGLNRAPTGLTRARTG